MSRSVGDTAEAKALAQCRRDKDVLRAEVADLRAERQQAIDTAEELMRWREQLSRERQQAIDERDAAEQRRDAAEQAFDRKCEKLWQAIDALREIQTADAEYSHEFSFQRHCEVQRIARAALVSLGEKPTP